ncbi:scarecrow-like protein 34 [Panicum virgatum]|uniref:Uncharacterized protein n=1 Tax=Panicum virgatum TaxID=38727 RepID=A0A8T0UJK6_PANVG|nr:scarecrow-like protein 34 [Panicum virgatum]KAG2621033.1 hypothetical protein PVAP13_3NG203300 [Panicum virgatum]
MAAASEDLTDPEPFSPSVFLNLSPTTPPPAPSPKNDDLVLPLISRMLMAEDTDDNFLYQRQHPDDTALLQAQQTFADILSDASSSASTKSSGSASAVPFTFAISPPSSDAPAAFASTTCCWPYDPAELSRLLLSRTHPNMTMPPPADVDEDDGEHDSSCFLSDQNSRVKVNMEMLNQAFLKGMEEASKFLPTTTTNDNNLMQDSCDGRGRGSKKKRHNRGDQDDVDALEAEAGRRSKLMAPEESGEVADGVFLKGYEVSLEKMHGLSISGSSLPVARREEEERAKSQRSNSNEAVDLRTLLTHCAEAVSAGNHLSATALLRQIKQRSSPSGDASQRLAHCFAQGLELRLAGMGAAAKPKRTSAIDHLRAYQLHLQVCSFRMVAFKFSHMAITRAVAGRKKVHIVDYGEHRGFQWPLLLDALATREGGPPEVRITGITFPYPGFRPAARIKETERRLSDFARQRGIPFRFRSIVSARWETISAEDLVMEPDEVLVVNGLFYFGKLMDEGVDDIDSPSPRDMVLGNISKMRPDVFILCVENSSQNAPFFVTRFRETLFYYSAMFDMMDSTAPRDCAERMLVEEIFGHWAMDAIAYEGSDRVLRPETYKQWQTRSNRAGLRQLPLDPDTVRYLSKRVKEGYHNDFVIDVDQQWLLQGWKGRILCAMSTWVADDDAI